MTHSLNLFLIDNAYFLSLKFEAISVSFCLLGIEYTATPIITFTSKSINTCQHQMLHNQEIFKGDGGISCKK